MEREILALSAFLGFGLACGGMGRTPDKLAQFETGAKVLFGDEGAYHGPSAHERYTPCDALVMASAWQTTQADAYKVLDTKLYSMGPIDADASLVWARQQVTGMTCSHTDNGFTWDDVELLASAWGTSTAEAKAAIERKIPTYGAPYVRELLDAEAGR